MYYNKMAVKTGPKVKVHAKVCARRQDPAVHEDHYLGFGEFRQYPLLPL